MEPRPPEYRPEPRRVPVQDARLGAPPRDNRTLIIAGVIVPLVILTAVISYYLLVAVPDREARDREAVAAVEPAAEARVPTDEGDGFEPAAADLDVPEAPAPAASDAERGLEGAPRRSTDSAAEGYGQPAPEPLQAFARRYLALQSGGDADALLQLYRTPMPYNDMPENGDGQVFGSTISQERQAFFQDFPSRRYVMAGPARTVDPEGSGDIIRFDYTFVRSGGAGGTRSGRAWTELAYVPDGNSFAIVGENGGEY